MDVDIDKVKSRLREAFIHLYNNDLCADKQNLKQVTVEGLLGITLNNEHIVLVNVNENLSSDVTETRLNVGRPFNKGATKRPFPHKNVRTKPFKRHKAATDDNPPAANTTSQSTNSAEEPVSASHDNTPLNEDNPAHRESADKDGDGSEVDGVAPSGAGLSDHVTGAEVPTASIKSEPVTERHGEDAAMDMDIGENGANTAVNESSADTHEDKEAGVAPGEQVSVKLEVKEEESEDVSPVKVEGEESGVNEPSVGAQEAQTENNKNPPAVPQQVAPPGGETVSQASAPVSAQSNTPTNHSEVIPNHNAMVTDPATTEAAPTPSSGGTQPNTATDGAIGPVGGVDHMGGAPTTTTPLTTATTTGQNYTEKQGGVGGEMGKNPPSSVNWFSMGDPSNCGGVVPGGGGGMTNDGFSGENMMGEGAPGMGAPGMGHHDDMVTDTAQLFAATYQVLDGEEDGLMPPSQHGFYDKSHAHTHPGGNRAPHMGNFQNAMGNNNQSGPNNMAAVASCSTGQIPNQNSNMPSGGNNVNPGGGPMPPHSSAHKPSEPPKLAHRSPQNPMGGTNPAHRPAQQPPYPPGMWGHNPGRMPGPTPPHPRPAGPMPPYGSPGPAAQPRGFPPGNYPGRTDGNSPQQQQQPPKSFENQFSDFIRTRHPGPYPPRGVPPSNMHDASRAPPSPQQQQQQQMQSPNSAQNFQSPNVTMNKYQAMNRYPFHQSLGPASGAIRDLACRVPNPQFSPRSGPAMMQGGAGVGAHHQPMHQQHPQHPQQQQPPQAQSPYNQGHHPQQQPQQQQQQGYMGHPHAQHNPHHNPHHPHQQWNQPNIPAMNQHQMMSQRQTPPHSQAQQNFHHHHHQGAQQHHQMMRNNDGSPVPQIASPSLSQQAISNIPPIDPPPIQHRATPEKPSTPKKKKSSPKISRESTQESVKMQEEKALLENPHANVHIGHPKGKKCKFHRTKNSKDKYTVFGCRACNVALCKECHDEYHTELNESQQQHK